VLFERRALLFDLGDIAALPPRKVLRTSHVFVTHTHGPLHRLRPPAAHLPRARRPLTLYGPEGFIDQVQHKLAAFTWNLVENYAVDPTITACEVDSPAGTLGRAMFNSRERFARHDLPGTRLDQGLLLSEPAFEVRCAVLDHKTPCLAFAVQEAMHVNVWRNRLTELGVAPGPWLREVKRAVLAGASDDTTVSARWRDEHGAHEQGLLLGVLKEHALQLVPGERIAYVTDVAFHAENQRRIVELASQADLLYIEATFLEEDAADAARKYHLTARQAGTIA
jgi:ribonuclease Z